MKAYGGDLFQALISHILKIYINIILPSTSGSFPQFSSPKRFLNLSYPPYALHAPSISFFMIPSPEQYCVSSTER